jgi:hypothetical protein
MTKQSRQQLSILVVLLAVLSLTVVLGYRMIRPPSAATVEPTATANKPAGQAPVASNATIHLDMVDKEEDGDQDIGTRNLFQYKPLAPPPPPPRPSGSFGNPNNAQPSQPTQQIVTRPVPPPIPQINLKYQGFAVSDTPSKLTAFLADDARHYNVTAGEILLGRYRIVTITEKSVEVEDLDNNRRQVLPMVK